MVFCTLNFIFKIKYEHNNAETEDLWEELDKSRDNNEIKIKDLIDS